MEKQQILNRLTKTEKIRFLRVIKNLNDGNKVGWIDGNAIAHYVVQSYSKYRTSLSIEPFQEYAHETRERIREYVEKNYGIWRNDYI